ncbi:MAG: hypothetical protein HY815_14925 [Candidatus Riflebacteria bacterium]|nr:hypothetical protein [Candidatus Riflebacteria bacterium]
MMASMRKALAVAAVLSLVFALGPALAEQPTYELKVAKPGAPAKIYKEAFPTEVQATAWLWNRLKIDALEEQTQQLKIDFQAAKGVRFERKENLAHQVGAISIQNQCQLSVGEQMLFSAERGAVGFSW